MNTISRLVLAALVFAVAGCNSGGNEAARAPVPPVISPPPPPPVSGAPDYVACANQPSAAEPSLTVPTASPGGIWTGTLTDDTRRTARYFEAVVGEDGRFHFRTYGDSTDVVAPQFGGILSTAGNTLAGTGRAYLARGDQSYESTYSGDLELTGVIVERQRFSAQWSAASGDSGCLYASNYYAYDYEQSSAEGVPSRTWTAYLGPSLVLTTDPDGRFNGQGGEGCIMDGRIAQIDERFGVYAIALSTSACAAAGDYAGLAYICWSCGWGEPYLLLYFDNGVRATHRIMY